MTVPQFGYPSLPAVAARVGKSPFPGDWDAGTELGCAAVCPELDAWARAIPGLDTWRHVLVL